MFLTRTLVLVALSLLKIAPIALLPSMQGDLLVGSAPALYASLTTGRASGPLGPLLPLTVHRAGISVAAPLLNNTPNTQLPSMFWSRIIAAAQPELEPSTTLFVTSAPL